MNKVITINLNGNAFPLEENGYEALRSYLDTAARRLDGNPDKDEIIADIEQAIADKFRAVLGAYKTVVVTKEVERIIAEMGPVQDPSAPPDEPPPSNSGSRASRGAHLAEEFIRRAKEGYYEGMKTFGDRKAHREWKRRFKWEMRGWKRSFKREMHENAHHWGQSWSSYWSPPSRLGLSAFIVFPVIAILRALIALLGLFALISLICTGAVFGLALPFSAPLWVGILFLFVVYKIMVWPLKAVHHAFFFNAFQGSRYAGPWVGLMESLIWIAFLIVFFWFATHHRAQVHDTLQHLPHVLRHAADSIRQWWKES